MIICWFGRCIGICTVLTQKCGESQFIYDTISARNSIIFTVSDCLKSKERQLFMEFVDSKTDRIAMTGPYSKDTDGQMYTS